MNKILWARFHETFRGYVNPVEFISSNLLVFDINEYRELSYDYKTKNILQFTELIMKILSYFFDFDSCKCMKFLLRMINFHILYHLRWRSEVLDYIANRQVLGAHHWGVPYSDETSVQSFLVFSGGQTKINWCSEKWKSYKRYFTLRNLKH